MYGLDPIDVSAALQHRVQASAVLHPVPGTKDKVLVQIQGNQIQQVGNLLLGLEFVFSSWHIDLKCLHNVFRQIAHNYHWLGDFIFSRSVSYSSQVHPRPGKSSEREEEITAFHHNIHHMLSVYLLTAKVIATNHHPCPEGAI
jgi:hypothetical protein